jgi:hypothetical protein
MMMIRRIGGIVAGVLVAGGMVAAVEAVGHALLTAPADATQASLPMLGMVLLAWTLGALAGALTAALIARWTLAAYVPAAFVILGIAMNALNFPQPLWMTLAGAAFAWLAARFAARFAASREPGGPSARGVVA